MFENINNFNQIYSIFEKIDLNLNNKIDVYLIGGTCFII